jgi:hypothetical protein
MNKFALHEGSCCHDHDQKPECCYNSTLYLFLETNQHPSNVNVNFNFLADIQNPFFSIPNLFTIPGEIEFTNLKIVIARKIPIWLQNFSLILYG